MIKEFLICYVRPTSHSVEKRVLWLVRHAWEHVPFYREKMQATGLSASDFNSLDDYISKFPETTAAEYRAYQQTGHSQGLIDERRQLGGLIEDRSSGSSGITISVFRTPAEYELNRARALWHLVQAGLRPWHRILAILPPLQMRKDVSMSILQSMGIFRRTAVDYTMPIETIVDVIRRERINVIYGQKSFIRLIADHYMQQGIDPPTLELLIPGAERVDHYDREYLGQAFRPRRFGEFYGATEPYLIAAKKWDNDYQVDYKAVFFTLTAPEDESGLTKGNILVTSLINEAQPILKLELGDRVAVRNYSQLSQLGATIAKVEGRSNDYLHLPDGEKISGATFYASLEYFPFMRQFKIVQNDVNDCTVMLRITEKTEEKKAQIDAVLKKLLDGRIKYAVEYVDAIPVDPNGKTKILVSSVKDAKSASLHR